MLGDMPACLPPSCTDLFVAKLLASVVSWTACGTSGSSLLAVSHCNRELQLHRALACALTHDDLDETAWLRTGI